MIAHTRSVFRNIGYIVLCAVMVSVWLLLIMVYTDRFPAPFDRLVQYLMPWKGLFTSATAQQVMPDRISLMESLLDASNRVSRGAFIVLSVSFVSFSAYVTFVYQEKQRRSRENELLQIKNQEIARRNEFIRYITATIGHEFKNNLVRIKRRLELTPDLDNEIRERLFGNMDKLFADIEIFKRISEAREEGLVDFGKISLRSLIADIGHQYGDLADVEFQEGGGPYIIYASAPLLKAVFENLFDNAIKYKKEEQERARIAISFAMDFDGDRPYITISFRDEGTGMNEEQAEQCFYKWTKSAEGWGQGLYYVKYIVGLHAGKIRIGKEKTSPGKGTEIILHLPFVEEAVYV